MAHQLRLQNQELVGAAVAQPLIPLEQLLLHPSLQTEMAVMCVMGCGPLLDH